jgi:hypothetical protein
MLKEAKKTYFKEIEKIINDKYITDEIEEELKRFRNEFNKGKDRQEGFNLLIQQVRDNVSFHYKGDVCKDIVTDEQPSGDLRIAFAKSDKIIDCIYELPYTAILSYIKNLIPEENKENPFDWLFEETERNTHKFVSILEKIAGKFLKTNGYKKFDRVD